jgi:hypothetical protein
VGRQGASEHEWSDGPHTGVRAILQRFGVAESIYSKVGLMFRCTPAEWTSCYSRNALSEQRSFRYSTTSDLNIAETGNNSLFTRENHSATIQLIRKMSPTTVLDVRSGLAHF